MLTTSGWFSCSDDFHVHNSKPLRYDVLDYKINKLENISETSDEEAISEISEELSRLKIEALDYIKSIESDPLEKFEKDEQLNRLLEEENGETNSDITGVPYNDYEIEIIINANNDDEASTSRSNIEEQEISYVER